MPEALVISDTTYAGTAASMFLTRAVIGSDTIQKGCVMVEDGIKKKKTLPRIEVSRFMQKRAATPTSKGVVTVDAKALTPLDAMLYYEFNPRDFESHWQAEQLSPKLLGRELPVTVENFMIMQTMKRLNEFFEHAWWSSRLSFDPDSGTQTPAGVGDAGAVDEDGNPAYYYWDGFIKKALDDATTLAVSSPVALTGGAAGNIVDKFKLAYALIPAGLLYKYGAGGLKILVSYADQKKYEDFLTESTYKNNDTTEKGINRWKGYDIVPLAGIPENTFFFCIAKPDIDSNLWIGLNSVEDNQLELRPVQNNSELFFVKGLFKCDTQTAFGDQLVIYTTITA